MKISWGQVLVLLFLSRVFTLMTYTPMFSEENSYAVYMTGVVISTAIQVLILLPIILLNKKYPDKSFMEIANSKSSFLGAVFSAGYLVFLISVGVNSVTHFERFLTSGFAHQTSAVSGGLVLIAIGIYGAYRGLQGIARSGGIVFITLISVIFLIILTSYKAVDMLNFTPQADFYYGNLFTAVKDDLSRSGEIALIAPLMVYTKDLRKGVYGFIAAKLVIVEVILFFIITVLGGYTELVEYPFYSLGSYSGGAVARLDAIYMVVWSLIAIINISLVIFACSEILKSYYKRLKFTEIITGVVIFLCTLPVFYKIVNQSIVNYKSKNIQSHLCKE